tara:strand:+ start:977 stop:1105 length:129 start_codon:yes stop_codon:yes gene_type:complete
MSKEEFSKKIAESDLHDRIKVFLLLNFEKFDDEQKNWLIDNL